MQQAKGNKLKNGVLTPFYNQQYHRIMDRSFDAVPLIEKEIVGDLKFPSAEVLFDKSAIQQRVAALHHATSLGNLDHHKVNIYFEDSEGLKRVNTTIWAITDKRILLKNGKSIPINRIHEVVII